MGSVQGASAVVSLGYLGLALLVLVAYAVRTWRWGRWDDPRLARLRGSPFLGRWLVEAFYWAFSVPGRALARLGAPPDVITLVALALSLAAAPLAATGQIGVAGGLLLGGAILDVLDGMVARATGRSSRGGELLDSVLDRYADSAPLIGLAVFYRGSAAAMTVPLVALVGSMLLSYIRAKAEGLALALPSGAMRRHERVVYLGAALLLGPWLSAWLGSPAGIRHPAVLAVLGLLAIASNVAAIRLFLRARAALRVAGEPTTLELVLARPWGRFRAWLAERPESTWGRTRLETSTRRPRPEAKPRAEKPGAGSPPS